MSRRRHLALRLGSAALAALAALTAAPTQKPLEAASHPLAAEAWPLLAPGLALAAAVLVAAKRPGAGYLAALAALAASLAAGGVDASSAAAAVLLLLASSALYNASLRLEVGPAVSARERRRVPGPALSLLLHGFSAAIACYGAVLALRLYEALLTPPRGLTGPGALALRLLSESPTAKLVLAAAIAAGLYYLASAVAAPLLYLAAAEPGEARAAVARSLLAEAERARRGMLWYHRVLRWGLRFAGLLLGLSLASLLEASVASLLGAPGPAAATLLAALGLLAAWWLLGLLGDRPGRWRVLALASASLLLLLAAYTAAVEPGWLGKDLETLWAAATGGQPPPYRVDAVLSARLAYYEGVLARGLASVAELLELMAKLFWG